MSDLEKRLTKALTHITDFTNRAGELISKITVKDLIEEGGINPYMIAALGIDDIENVVELFVYRRVERSLGTSFGNAIEAFLRDLLGGVSGRDFDKRCKKKDVSRKPWICWWDIVIPKETTKDGKAYKGIVISVKSGPADINKDIIKMFIQYTKEAEENGYKAYLVLTYGRQAFNVAVSTLRNEGLDPKKYLLVGRDIFREFLGDPNYYDHVINTIRTVSKKVDVFRLIEKKVTELTEELKRRYGNDIDKILRQLS